MVGTQNSGSLGTVDQSCVNDVASPRVFCHVAFDVGVSGWLTVEHLIVLSTPSSLFSLETSLQELFNFLSCELAEAAELKVREVPILVFSISLHKSIDGKQSRTNVAQPEMTQSCAEPSRKRFLA